MKTINFTNFRKKASGLLKEVEQGERLLLTRHGKPIAEVIPPSHETKEDASWKQPFTPLEMKGLNLSSAVLEEREDEQ
jgi:prevent-host-death family protein